MKTLVINLAGAPGAGKSTLATEIFSKLKKLGYNCEYVDEYAKHLVYEGNNVRLQNQLMVFSNQFHAQYVLNDKVDIIITDSPLLFSIFYNKLKDDKDIAKLPDKLITELVLHAHNSFDNLNYFLVRNHDYQTVGRLQTESEAQKYQEDIKTLYKTLNLDFKVLNSTENCFEQILKDIDQRNAKEKGVLKMNKEIERKFLLPHLPSNINPIKTIELTQAYINEGGLSFRVRNIDNKKFILTEKNGKGLVRSEMEKEIDENMYNEYILKAEQKVVKKTRQFIPLRGNYIAEVDVYHEQNKGLMTVEVEFDCLEAAKYFNPPDWFGEEVTGQEKYLNENLANNSQNDFAQLN